MKKIAICGPSGVGKGFICNRIGSEFGFPVLDTDRVVHDMYEKDPVVINDLAGIFGNKILKNGSIDRGALGSIVFCDPQALDTLNKTVHKHVRSHMLLWFKAMEELGFDAAVVDIPQIVESGMAGEFDLVIGVEAELHTRMERITARDGISAEDARRRIENQLPAEEYRKVCHYTVKNDGPDSFSFDSIKNIFKEVHII